MLPSARELAHTYKTPASTTVIATIRMVAITGLTASSFLFSFFIFLSSIPESGVDALLYPGYLNLLPIFFVKCLGIAKKRAFTKIGYIPKNAAGASGA